MILFGIWGVALFGAWLAGMYDGQQYGWMPLLVGALFCWATLLDRVGARFFARLFVIAGVLTASVFVGTLSGVAAGLQWLMIAGIFMAFAVAIYLLARNKSVGDG